MDVNDNKESWDINHIKGGTSSTFELYSSSNSEKDTLIDEMQIKFGDMLKNNQALYGAKNQADMLRELINKKEAEFQEETQKLNLKIASLTRENSRILEENKILKANNQTVIAKNNDLQENIAYLENKVKDIQNAVDNKVKRAEDESNSLRLKLETTRNEKNNLEMKLQSLSDSYSKSQEEIHASKVLTDQLAQSQAKFEGILSKHQNKIESLFNENTEMQKKLQNEVDEKYKISQKFESLSHNYELLQHTIETLETENKYAQDKISNLQEQLFNIIQACPNATTSEDVIQHINSTKENSQKAQESLKKEKAQLKKAIGIIQEKQAENERLHQENEAEKLKNVYLSKTIRNREIQNNQLKNKVERVVVARHATLTLCQTNQELVNQIKDLYYRISGEEPIISMRSFIIMAISLRRWRQILGTEPVFVKDIQNWWWLGKAALPPTPYEKVAEQISTIAADHNKVVDEMEAQKKLLNDASDGIKEAEETINRMDAENAELKKTIADQKKRLDDLEEQYSGMPGVHVSGLLKDIEQLRLELESATQARDNERQRRIQATEELQQWKSKATSEAAAHKRTKFAFDTMRGDLFASTAERESLRRGSSQRDKDMLALERASKRANEQIKAETAQEFILTGQNQRLTEKVLKQKNLLRESIAREAELEKAVKISESKRNRGYK